MDTDRNFELLLSAELPARRLAIVNSAADRARVASALLIDRLDPPKVVRPVHAPIMQPELVSDPYAGITNLSAYGAHERALAEARSQVDIALSEAA